MSALGLGTAVLVAAAGLALWVDVRLGDRSPSSMVKVVMVPRWSSVTMRLARGTLPVSVTA